MSNSLVTQQDRSPTSFGGNGIRLQSFDDAVRFATAVYQSGLAPKGFQNAQAVLVAMQAGMELGLTPLRAIQSVAVINGRPSLWGDALLAVAMNSPVVVDVTERMDGDGEQRRAVCVVTRSDGKTVERAFSVDDAKRAGLWGKAGPWSQYPDRMLQMRARSFAIRDGAPEALCGFTTIEESDDIGIGPDRARDITPPSTPDPLLARLSLPEPDTINGGREDAVAQPPAADPDNERNDDPSDAGSGGDIATVAAWDAGSAEQTKAARIPLNNPATGEVRYFATVGDWCKACAELVDAGDWHEVWTANLETHTRLTQAARSDEARGHLKAIADYVDAARQADKLDKGPGA